MEYPFNAVVLTRSRLTHDIPTATGGVTRGDFVVDLASVVVPTNPCVVDYNHDDDQIVGRATITTGTSEILAEGVLVSCDVGDKAEQIASQAKLVPFGVSPTFDFTKADRVDVPEHEEVDVNGWTYEGPIVVFRNAPLLGISVCPYPTDDHTVFTPLSRNDRLTACSNVGVMQMNKRTTSRLAIDQTDPAVPEPDGGEPTTVKDEELQKYVDAFGAERGVAYYQQGVPFDEAIAADYEQTKEENAQLKARLSRLEGDGAACDDKDEDEEEEKKTANGVDQLRREIVALKRELSLSRLSRSGGVSPSTPAGLPAGSGLAAPKSYVEAFRSATRNM